MIRLLNILVIAALVLAAADVYKIKFESTRQAQRVAKLRMDIRRENDAIAALRAEWSKLDNPARIQELARRHLALKPVEGRQFDRLDQLPGAAARSGAGRRPRSDRHRAGQSRARRPDADRKPARPRAEVM